jgi:hypothetical protein
MLSKALTIFKKKSLKERFLLFTGILFFLIYLTLGLIIIFWEEFPITMDTKYRVAFGVLLIGYAFIRFLRFFNSNKN